MNNIFNLGRIVKTRSIDDTLPPYLLIDLITRHAINDWPDLSEEEIQRNKEAYENNKRVTGMYITEYGKVCLMTEGDRSFTSIFFVE